MDSYGTTTAEQSLTPSEQTLTTTSSEPPPVARPGRLRALWSAVVGAVGVVVGLAPHVLHHVGFLVGTALVAGAAGTALFGVLGLVASVPMLLRLRRRFSTWWAPGIALAVFAVMFTLSTVVIGPAISGRSPFGGSDVRPSPATTPTAPISSSEHASHHQP